jgi:GNAT superfamily N-acetyltransferase
MQRMRTTSGHYTTYRVAIAADLPAICRVPTSMIENPLSVAQLQERGITNATVAASFGRQAKGSVAERDGRIVGLSISDRTSHSLFALFVLPAYEGQGIGDHRLKLALGWRWNNGTERAWLTTGAHTKAAAFYERRGWVKTGIDATGDIRYECERPTDWVALDEPARPPKSGR